MGETEARALNSRCEDLDATPPLLASEQQTESTPHTEPATETQVASASGPADPSPDDARVQAQANLASTPAAVAAGDDAIRTSDRPSLAEPLLAATPEAADRPAAPQEPAAGTFVEGAAGIGETSAAPSVAVNGADGSEATPAVKRNGSVKRAVSFKTGINGGVHGDEAESVPQKKAHSSIVIDRNATMSGYCKRSAKDTITIKFEDVRLKVEIKANSSWLPSEWGGIASCFMPKKRQEKEKQVLHGVSGSVLPGEVLAVMGPSGGGKTSFLNVVGGRVPMENVSGHMTYNDQPYSKNLKRRIGFVTQDDLFFAHLTVRETLMYAAILRLPRELSWEQKVQRADDTIEELGLAKCKDTIIGGHFLRGISGGERKRVSIGHEILIDPSILLLDEPTSGLDSTTALRIIQVLHNLARSGRTVVTTIHQPSSRLFHSFDKLLLLSEGNSVFFGLAADAMGYFEHLGFEPEFATNPADFILDLANGTTGGISLPADFGENPEWQKKSPAEQQSDIKRFFADKHGELQLQSVLDEVHALPRATDEERLSVSSKRGWSAPWWLQFSVLWTRGLKERWHEYLSPLRFYQVIALALICGCLWFGSSRDTEAAIQDQVGLIFFISIFWGFFPLFAAIFTFPQERAMLAKERASDMYRLSSYFLSRTLSDLPMEWTLPTLFLCIAYFMANLNLSASAFFCTLFGVYLIVTTAQGCGFFLGAAVMEVKKATVFASVLLLTFMLAGGYYLQYIPPFINWIKYISFTWYAYRLLLKVQFSPAETYSCGPNLALQCPMQSAPAFKNVTLSDAWVDALALLAQVVIYRGFAYIALRRMKLAK